MFHPFLSQAAAACPGFVFATAAAHAQSNLSIYTDQFVNGFQDWSWAAHNPANTSPVHSGSYSISVNDVAWTGISFYQAGFNSYQGGFDLSGYTNFSFWANGGTRGGQQLQSLYPIWRDQRRHGPAVPVADQLLAAICGALEHPGSRQRHQCVSLQYRADLQRPDQYVYLDDIQLTTSPGPSARPCEPQRKPGSPRGGFPLVRTEHGGLGRRLRLVRTP